MARNEVVEAGRDFAPAGDLLSFCGAKKKVGKEKGPSLFGHAASTRSLRQEVGKIYGHRRFIAATEAMRPNRLAPLSLLTFFLARQKESESPAGARPSKPEATA